MNEEKWGKGVRIIDLAHTYIDENVTIGEGTVIYPNVSIRGTVSIGKDNVIDSNTVITDAKIGNQNYIVQSNLTGCEIADHNQIGPFTNIRENTYIGNNNHIGSFVELKSASIQDYNHIKHLFYGGDVEIGTGVNIGAGTVIANYDAKKKIKQQTKIEDQVAIGANCVLISPITVEKNSQVAAGSVITESVPAASLAIARSRQTTKEDYYKGEQK